MHRHINYCRKYKQKRQDESNLLQDFNPGTRKYIPSKGRTI